MCAHAISHRTSTISRSNSAHVCPLPAWTLAVSQPSPDSMEAKRSTYGKPLANLLVMQGLWAGVNVLYTSIREEPQQAETETWNERKTKCGITCNVACNVASPMWRFQSVLNTSPGTSPERILFISFQPHLQRRWRSGRYSMGYP